MGCIAIMNATLILVVIFFMLVAIKKLEEGPIKSFGRILVLLLSVGAILLSCLGVYSIAAGRCYVISRIGKLSTACGDKKMSSFTGGAMKYGMPRMSMDRQSR